MGHPRPFSSKGRNGCFTHQRPTREEKGYMPQKPSFLWSQEMHAAVRRNRMAIAEVGGRQKGARGKNTAQEEMWRSRQEL